MRNNHGSSAPGLSPNQPSDKNTQRCQRIPARTAEVGGIPVARVLPSRQRRLIGAMN